LVKLEAPPPNLELLNKEWPETCEYALFGLIALFILVFPVAEYWEWDILPNERSVSYGTPDGGLLISAYYYSSIYFSL
jgi:hypothetical protein